MNVSLLFAICVSSVTAKKRILSFGQQDALHHDVLCTQVGVAQQVVERLGQRAIMLHIIHILVNIMGSCVQKQYTSGLCIDMLSGVD